MHQNASKKSLALTVLAIAVLAIAGLVGLSQSVSLLILSARSNSWPKTNGILVKAKPELQYVSRGKAGRNVWMPHVIYRYRVEGNEFTNDYIYIDNLGIPEGEDSTKRFLKKYLVGDSVPVFYDAESPEKSVLIPGIRNKAWMNLAFCFVYLFLVGLIVRAARKVNRTKGSLKTVEP